MSGIRASAEQTAPAQPPRTVVDRYFEISLLLALATGFATLATTGKLDLISVVYIFFYPLDLLVFSPGPSFADRMLAATVHLVLFTTVIKVFSARTYRDYVYLAALSFLMMLAGAILTVSTKYLALGVKEATLAYRRFLRVLRRKGIQKPASQTPQELALSLAGSEFGPGALEFTRLYNALRFGQTPVSVARLRSVLEEISRSRRPQAGGQV